MSRLEKILLLSNTAVFIVIAVFSYCYVDLNLTLSSNQSVLSIVNILQHFGYYLRPQATLFYLILQISSFTVFGLNIYFAFKKKIQLKYVAYSVIVNTLILIFAYPYLSYDIFNYMFDAKIITTYHLSPYDYRPLDFPQDEWIRFMRWTHRYSPYGPLWLIASVVPSLLGFGKFIATLLLFKISIAVFHLLNTLLIYKILKKLNVNNILPGVAFYALNPLFLIEGIANAHNDVIVATFTLLSIFYFIQGKRLSAVASLLVGSGVKYISILIAPFLFVFKGQTKQETAKIYILLNLITFSIFTYVFSSFEVKVPFIHAGSTQVQFQPWYLFWTLPLVALIANRYVLVAAFTLAFSASLRYLPFLYYGDWSHSGTTVFMQFATIIPPIIAAIFLLSKKILEK